ncbi:uncharacterized protein K02A2.6-like [Corticium candelabrum]|uniref:uncharacterized protein K02A2.6-like n=2 Tax=Corticium candelabrum TaxID=121492 RepID=UPI002E254B1A|nr:uncharacterized protein K02A2.6-like [Corticium candelabrum]
MSAEIQQLVSVLQEQIRLTQQQHKEEMEQQREIHMRQIDILERQLKKSHSTVHRPDQKFQPFDSTSELWRDYWSRFQTFTEANSLPEEKLALVFLTNQSSDVFKLIDNYASQLTPPTSANKLSMNQIQEFMSQHFDPKRFVVRERFRFWSEIKRKPGETPHELAARVRQMATTCDFPSIKDPLDEAMRSCFLCAINNEAVLKAAFKTKEEDLTFQNVVQIATEVEEAAKTAKAQVYAKPDNVPVHKITSKSRLSTPKPHSKQALSTSTDHKPCASCGKKDHPRDKCRHRDAECHFCKKKGHIEAACRSKQTKKVRCITSVNTVRSQDIPQLQIQISQNGKQHSYLVDTGARMNFISLARWKAIGKPPIQPTTEEYRSASGHNIPILGTTCVESSLLTGEDKEVLKKQLEFTVTKLNLNLIGLQTLLDCDISILDSLICETAQNTSVCTVSDHTSLQKACQQLTQEFPDLWKNELGCLKDFQLEVKFKSDAKPVFCKPRTVPFALLDDLSLAYNKGIDRGLWKRVQFNDYGTPVVPVRKSPSASHPQGSIRVCGDYSVTVNPQLETHRHPLPLPEDLMHRLGGGYYFSKIDLADAYNQIPLGPESQKRLALSTHKGVLLQKRLPYGISSAPGYFQEIMEQLTSDLSGVAVYLDDILVSGRNAEDHLHNLRGLLKRLNDKGLRCRLEKCAFAQSRITYLGHTLLLQGLAKGPKVDAVMQMPPPKDVATLKSFLGSIQFYRKFLPNLATAAEPLTRLTRKDVRWKWTTTEQTAFNDLKAMLNTDTVLAHFNPSCPIGISCDASDVGIGAVLFHRYPDGSERPIANASKTLSSAQKKYSQIQKEALSIIFALHKFHQFLYGRHFILVTDHRPLLAMFGPHKATPVIAANRLARWALMLSQYDYTIEYRETSKHGNADALSRLPAESDPNFDRKESDSDIDTVCLINTISTQINSGDQNKLRKETAKDPVITEVLRYVREGWPKQVSDLLKDFKTKENSLTTINGCLMYGNRVVIPRSLQPEVLKILHEGHFGMQRMKQLARTAVYWPRIDADIQDTCHRCTACAEHQNKPAKAANHPWMLPEKPWSRVHVDHAIDFMGHNWLVVVDSYSKYPCIHPTSSTSTKSTTRLLEEDFAHFGYPHALVSDNATSFTSQEFKTWCQERGIVHLTGAPYHPATNGAAERLVQTFKNSLKKSSKPPREALQEFLMQYRRSPLPSGYSPSELLNNRLIRAKIDTLVPSPAHEAQGRQAREATKSQAKEFQNAVHKVNNNYYQVGRPCYALYCGPRRTSDPRWVPATVIRVHGSRSVNVKVHPRGPIWRRHIEQLRPRYGVEEDTDPGTDPGDLIHVPSPTLQPDVETNSQECQPSAPQYGPGNPRRSTRIRKPKKVWNC